MSIQCYDEFKANRVILMTVASRWDGILCRVTRVRIALYVYELADVE